MSERPVVIYDIEYHEILKHIKIVRKHIEKKPLSTFNLARWMKAEESILWLEKYFKID